ncbi:MAG: DUF983 domain-containing protein [Thermomicrobiales bacterium]
MTTLVDLPSSGWPRPRTLLGRALKRRCPYCGAPGIYSNWFSVREACPRRGTIFSREDGYFLGAYAINLIVAEFVGLGVVLVFLFRGDLSLIWQMIIAATAAVVLPIIFFPYSRTLWMALDLFLDRKPTERRLRGNEMSKDRRSS